MPSNSASSSAHNALALDSTRPKLPILDREPYRYQQFMSDISGQEFRTWRRSRGTHHKSRLAQHRRERSIFPSGSAIATRFALFQSDIPAICAPST